MLPSLPEADTTGRCVMLTWIGQSNGTCSSKVRSLLVLLGGFRWLSPHCPIEPNPANVVGRANVVDVPGLWNLHFHHLHRPYDAPR